MGGTIAKQSFWASIVNYTGSVIGLFTTFYLFPLTFSPSETGVFRLFIEMGALLAGVAQLGTGYSIWKFFPKFRSSGGHHGVGFWLLLLPLVGMCLVSAALFLFKEKVLLFFMENASDFLPYYNLLIPFVFFFVFNTVYETFSAALGRIVFASFLRENVVRVGLGILAFLYYTDHLTFYGVMLGVSLVYGTVCLLNIFSVHQLTQLSYVPDWKFITSHKELKSEFSFYTLYLFLTYVAMLVLQRMDFLMVSKMKGTSDTGIYSIALNLSILIEIPTRSILQIANPKLSEAIHHGNRVEISRLYQKTSLNQFVLGGIVLLGIWVNIDLFYTFMPHGDIYKAGKMAVLYLGLGKLMVLLQGNSSAMLIFSKRYYLTLVVNLIAIFTGVYMNQWLIPIMGISGAAVATGMVWLCTGIVVAILIWYIYKMQPFTLKVFQAILVLTLGFALNYVWPSLLSPNKMVMIFMYALKTSAILSAVVFVIYRFRISDDMISMMDKLLGRFRK